ncbi:hypothetical protein [Pseudoxanthomonas sp. PXM02]|uniref:hypothetical protein n=1 Tax=Pseudoxanthomonas sp. PXM02 TaxID=2769294 RepID=UPI00177DA891|nr:hypothetical protein [Pseudoxanthomonas sp. PXM02]MBD9481176.1 hypothetical protein [Pseudoxanthomonas sp. PXM02]
MRRTCLPARAAHAMIALLLALTAAGTANAQQRSVRGWTDGPYLVQGTGGSESLLLEWRFLDVYCIDMPRLQPVRDVVHGTLGGGAISFYRLRYENGLSAYVVTSTVPKDRTSADEYGVLLRREQDNARAISAATSPDRYRVDTGTSPWGPTVRMRLLNIGQDDPDEPFPVARPLLNAPDAPLYSLSVHRMFVHGNSRYEIAVLAVPADGETRAALEARADRLADTMVTSLQTCTAKLEAGEPAPSTQ